MAAASQRRMIDRRAHLHGEGTLLLQVREHRLQPVVQVRRVPVDDRALGQVGEVALDLGQLAVEDQAGADQFAGLVEPAEALRAPLRLDVRPAGDCMWLADDRLATKARCSSRLSGRTGRAIRGSSVFDRASSGGAGPRVTPAGRLRAGSPGGTPATLCGQMFAQPGDVGALAPAPPGVSHHHRRAGRRHGHEALRVDRPRRRCWRAGRRRSRRHPASRWRGPGRCGR